MAELDDVQGEPVDLGGYYFVDRDEGRRGDAAERDVQRRAAVRSAARRRRRPEARAIGRSTAARTAASSPTRMSRSARAGRGRVEQLAGEDARAAGPGSRTAAVPNCEPWLLWIVIA